MQNFIYLLITLVSCSLSIGGVSQAYGYSMIDDYSIWQAVIAAIAGAVLTSTSLFFFIRRIISQYDKKHDQHDEDIMNMQKNIIQIENNFKKGLGESTELIMETLNGLKDNLREIITDVAILKDDRKRCISINDRIDNNTGGLKVLEVQFESLMGALSRLERQMERSSVKKQ
jgi:hypothetical protein